MYFFSLDLRELLAFAGKTMWQKSLIYAATFMDLAVKRWCDATEKIFRDSPCDM